MVRLKNRYFLCELVNADGVPRVLTSGVSSLYSAIKSTVQEIHGDYGSAAISKGLNVKYLNQQTGVLLIRVRHQTHKILSTALPFIKSVEKSPVSLRTLHLSGTIRSCQKFLAKYNRRQLMILLQQCRTQDERRRVRESIRRCTLGKEESEFRDGAVEDKGQS